MFCHKGASGVRARRRRKRASRRERERARVRGGRGRGCGRGAARALRAPPPDAELLQCAAALANTKRLFAALLDQLCDEPDFADDDNDHCWNGNTVGE